jgi:hypothetical protein
LTPNLNQDGTTQISGELRFEDDKGCVLKSAKVHQRVERDGKARFAVPLGSEADASSIYVLEVTPLLVVPN